jgi:cytochrome c oxidase subunit III
VSTVIRVHELPSTLNGSRSPVWWGMLLLITIESIVFASLLASYIYLRLGQPVWPPAGFELPELLLPAINTGLLAAGAAAVFLGLGGLKKGDVGRLKLGLGAGLLLMLGGLVLKIIEMRDFGEGWELHAYGSIYWSINGLHAIHLFVALGMGATALVLALRGHYTAERRVGVQAVSLYWQFVAIAWVPVFIVLYFVPRWF